MGRVAMQVPVIVALLAIITSFYVTYKGQRLAITGGQKTRTTSNGTHEWSPTVLLISLDGLKPSYMESNLLPTLGNLSIGILPSTWPDAAVGLLTSDSMIPVSPSLTFPNHWSIQTGLQPSSHGIIANDFHLQSTTSAPQSDQSFYYTDPSRSWKPEWWKGTSIWEHLELLGVRTANLMWPGPPVTSNTISNSYFQQYQKGWTLDMRLEKVLSWLDEDDDVRPRFICAYVPDVDTVTHSLGPNLQNKDVQARLQGVDRFVLNVLESLKERNLTSIVNVVIVSDHGMTTTSNDRLLYLEDLLGEDLYSQVQHWDGWPNVGLSFANHSLLDLASQRLRNISLEGNKPYTVVNKTELVKLWKWDLTDTVVERVSDLWILPDIGWSVTTREEMRSLNQDYGPKGNHGYLGSNAEMHAFFSAMGPSIQGKSKRHLPPFPNLEIHNLVMDMLLIAESDRVPNNGTPGFWDEYLTTTSPI